MADAKEQPSVDYQKLLLDLMEAGPEEVQFRGKKRKIKWLHKHTQLKFSHIVLKEEDLRKRNVKLCACVLSNDVFAWFFPFVYAIRWRWYRYVLDLDDTDVLRVLYAAKKKIQYYQSEFITIFSTEMKNEMMQMAMTKSEAKAIQAERAGEQHSA